MSTETSSPAFTALMRGLTMLAGATRRRRMAMSFVMDTPAPEARAAIHRRTGTKYRNMATTMKPPPPRIRYMI